MASTTKMLLAQRILTRSLFNCTTFRSGIKHVRCFASSSNTESVPLFSRDDEFMKRYTEQASHRPTELRRGQDIWEDATIVKTTGILGKDENNVLHARIGVFWGREDALNVYKPVEPIGGGVVSLPLAELEAVNMALRQAVHERKLNRVIIQTDSEFVVKCVDRWLANWKNNDYMKRDGTPVKNRQHLEELDRLLSMIEAKIVHTNHKTRYDNDVVGALHYNDELAPMIDTDVPMFTLQTTISVAPTDKPVVYTSGTVRDASTKNRKFILAGYGIYWPETPVNDKCGRFVDFPVTMFRAQMHAIIETLEMAKKQNIKKLHIITDSDRFPRFYNKQWLKNDGTPVANFLLYKKIMVLLKDVDATFSYMPSKFNDKIEHALMLAEDGLAFPAESK